MVDLEGNEATYALAKHEFHSVEKEIFDATIGCKLNVFEKISFEKAVALAKEK